MIVGMVCAASATTPPSLPSSPPPLQIHPNPPATPHLPCLPTCCEDACATASDGYCDDGGAGSEYATCAPGSDCSDCGPRCHGAASALELSGMCSDNADFLGTYNLGGFAANAAPFYEHTDGHHFLYFDLDCSGTGAAARWILDSSHPNTTRAFDLGGDHSCSYAARLTTTLPSPPLGNHTWRTHCGSSWTDVELSWGYVGSSPPPACLPSQPPSPPL